MRIFRVLGVLAVALTAGSCSLDVPDEDTLSINIYVDMDKGTLGFEEVVNILVTARNVGFEPLTLSGPSDCLLSVDVLNNQGSVIWHSRTDCTGGTISEELVVGVDKVQSFQWNGNNLAGARLTGGLYHVRGVVRLDGTVHNGPPVSISLE